MRRRRPSSPGPAPGGAVGFTLVEVMLVVVILAIFAAAAIPYFAGTSSFQAMSAARRIASDLEYAQNLALTTQEAVTATFASATETYALSNASVTLIHPITKADFSVDFASEDGFNQLDIASANFNGTEAVTFDALGSPDNSGRITLVAGAHTYWVDVAPATGKITVTSAGP